jgi:hypothetical protein
LSNLNKIKKFFKVRVFEWSKKHASGSEQLNMRVLEMGRQFESLRGHQFFPRQYNHLLSLGISWYNIISPMIFWIIDSNDISSLILVVNIVIIKELKHFCTFDIILSWDIDIAEERVLKSTWVRPISTRKCRFSSVDREIISSSKLRISSHKGWFVMLNFSISDNTNAKPTWERGHDGDEETIEKYCSASWICSNRLQNKIIHIV